MLDYECGSDWKSAFVLLNANSNCNLDFRKSLISEDAERDSKLATWIAEMIDHNKSPQIIMGVFDQVDERGHSSGFSFNKKYMAAFTTVEVLLEPILDKILIRSRDENEHWLIILTSDHGGHKNIFGGFHGEKNGTDNIVPFGLVKTGGGPPLNELTQSVSHMDVHPTVMKWFGIDSINIDGRVQGL